MRLEIPFHIIVESDGKRYRMVVVQQQISEDEEYYDVMGKNRILELRRRKAITGNWVWDVVKMPEANTEDPIVGNHNIGPKIIWITKAIDKYIEGKGG